MQSSIEFRLLGPLEARRDGETLALGGPRQRALLAVLLLNANEVVSSERLIDELWGDAPPKDAAHTIQVFVSRLRKALGRDAVETKAPGYLVRASDAQLDVIRFERLRARGRDALERGHALAADHAFGDALSLFRGAPLADFAYESWAQRDAARLEEARLSCVEERIDAGLALGRHGELAGELERLASEHPLRERLRSQLMLALYRQGRQAEALECYQQTRALLDEELGIEPSPELRELHRRILNQDPSLTVVAPVARPGTNLPTPMTSFLGRERELAEITALLASEHVRLLTLTGPGGTGKTRLAVQAATELAAAYEDGTFWVPLAALRDPALVLPTAAQALDAGDDLAGHIADKQLLLVLDNFEQVMEAAPAVADLLAACPRLELLVTSRESLRVSGEQAYSVPPLDAADGVELFLTRARAVEPAFEASHGVPELCSRLDNLPLALELAAARTTVFSPDQLVERLAERLDLLKGPRDADPRQQTLRATIAWSTDLLAEVEQVLFRKLSVFAGGCTYDAAEDVAGADPDTLQSLIEKSLIRHSNGRYWMLQTIRDYAAEALAASGDDEPTRSRHAAHYAALALEAEPNLRGTEMAATVRRLREEHDNVRAALAHDLDPAPERAVAAASALQRFWYFGGHSREGLAVLDAALARDPELSVEERAKALRAAGTLCECHGDYERARPLLEESVALLRDEDTPNQLALALNNLGAVSLWQGDYDAARACFEESLALKRRLDDELGAAMTLSNLAILAVKRADYGAARATQSEAVEILRRLGDPSSISIALQSLGEAALLEGDARLARRYLEEAMQHHASMDDPFSEAEQLVLLARCDLEDGRPQEACERLAQALERCVSLGHGGGLVLALEAAADIAAETDTTVALQLLGAAGAVRDELGAPPWMSDRAWRDRLLERVASTPGEPDVEALLAEGRRLDGEATIALALAALTASRASYG